MSDQIPRDLGSPFNPLDPAEFQEFEEFGCPPDTRQIFEDLSNQVEGSRAMRLFDPSLVQGFTIGPVPPDDENPPDTEQLDFLPIADRVAPDRPLGAVDHRGLHDLDLVVPGVGSVEMWSFRDNVSGEATWPAPTIRLREGEVIHAAMSNRRGPHTIHHHGLEPSSVNDGVGHLTFDVGGGIVYNYQFLAREAGTYFYHCHVNTVLHFEMGMYGMLIIDPDLPGAPYQDGGPGFVYVGNTPTSYQVEAIWVADDIDTDWHLNAEHGHSPDAGIICGEFQSINDPENPHFHDFNPDVFVVSGLPPETRGVVGARQLINAAGVTVARGQRLLVRALNASYTTTRWRFPVSLTGQIIAADGRTLGRSPSGAYSSPYTLASIGHQLTLTTAQRRDILIDTSLAATGQHLVEIDFHHWITDEIFDYGRLTLVITVS